MHISVQNITADDRSRFEEYCNEIVKIVEEHIK